MGSESGAPGAGGFFHLFDWNKKSRKKLFRNENACSGFSLTEKTIQGNNSDDSTQTSKFNLIDQDDMVGLARAKLSSHNSGALVTEEGSAFKTPGVVARLMGLDYIPASSSSESNSTGLHDSLSHADDSSQKRIAPLDATYNSYNDATSDIYSGKLESKFQKMPSSPIERFQVEMLPPRVAKTKSFTHHKLLSPVRNTALISPRNASYIIEAAARILESELHCGAMVGVRSIRSPLIYSKESGSHGIVVIPKNISTRLDSSSGITKPNDPVSLRAETSKRSSKVLKDDTSDQCTLGRIESHSATTKGRQNSASVGAKSKVNTLRKEGSSSKSGRTMVLNNQKNKQHRRGSPINNSAVLKQNNNKQNCLVGKSKLTVQPSISEQQGMKIVNGNASSDKRRIGNKLPGNAKLGTKGAETAYFDRDGMPSSFKSFKKRNSLVEHRSSSLRNHSSDSVAVGRGGAFVQQNLVADQHSRWHDDNTQKATDIVSFTFTSPMKKPMAGSLASSNELENHAKKHDYIFKTSQVTVRSNNQILSSSKLNSVEGDCLGILLEKKLRELTSGTQSPYSKLVKGDSASFASVLNDSEPGMVKPTVACAEHNMESLFRSCEVSSSCESDSLTSDQADQNMSYRLQVMDRMESPSSLEDEESGHEVQSLVSCHSIDSWEILNGSKIRNYSSSSSQAQDMVDWYCTSKTLCMEPEFSDSFSPVFQCRDGEIVSEIIIGSYTNPSSQELDYVKEIITNTGFAFEDLIPCPVDHSFEVLDPVLFDKLEETKASTAFEGEDKKLRIRRKILFDSVNECLDKKCSQYFRAGYQSWARGVAVVTNELAEQLYKEISGWSSIGDWMVDELVSEDMSTHLGGWINYEIEAFEAAVDIEAGVFNSLVDEVAADFL